jgi:HEPN domain-containing protein
MAVDVQQQIKYWKSEARRSFEIAQLLFEKNKRPEALFFGHLALEKIFKAAVVRQTKDLAPLIHDLNRLAKAAGLQFTIDQQRELQRITSFNIAGRYDNDKIAFHKQCTKPYTKKQMALIKDYFIWLEKNIFHNQ